MNPLWYLKKTEVEKIVEKLEQRAVSRHRHVLANTEGCGNCRWYSPLALRWFRRADPEQCRCPLNADLDTRKPMRSLQEVRESKHFCGPDGNWWRSR